jgi:3-oxoacyl-[acyl-carrier protein] reductase
MKVLITGGSRGIGFAIKQKFISEGHTVFAPTRAELDLNNNINLVDKEFDIVVNNAGINPLSSILDMPKEVMQVNYFAPLQIIQQCLPYMVECGYGRIVNIGSIWIELSKAKRAAYSASKSALDSLSRSITAEYSHHNILCNTVSPGFVATDLTYQNNTEVELNKKIQSVPLKRLGKPEEIADLVYYLAVQNNFITGQNIIIDGGYSCTA